MPATAQIIIVGLCTILNMKATDPHMAAPSVVCEAPAHDPYNHIAFFAFKKGDFSSATPGLIEEVPGSGGAYEYVHLQGDEIWLGVDVSKVPDHSDPLLQQLAPMSKFARLQSPKYNRNYIPEHGKRPSSVVGSFMRLGEGSLHGDFLTRDEWVFRNVENFQDTTISGRFVREIHYDFPLPRNFAVELRPLGAGTARTLTAANPNPTDMWAGSSAPGDIIKEIRRDEGSTPGGGMHFTMYYDQIASAHKTFIPYPASFRPRVMPRSKAEQLDVMMMMPDLGYCGPDGQP